MNLDLLLNGVESHPMDLFSSLSPVMGGSSLQSELFLYGAKQLFSFTPFGLGSAIIEGGLSVLNYIFGSARNENLIKSKQPTYEKSYQTYSPNMNYKNNHLNFSYHCDRNYDYSSRSRENYFDHSNRINYYPKFHKYSSPKLKEINEEVKDFINILESFDDTFLTFLESIKDEIEFARKSIISHDLCNFNTKFDLIMKKLFIFNIEYLKQEIANIFDYRYKRVNKNLLIPNCELNKEEKNEFDLFYMRIFGLIKEIGNSIFFDKQKDLNERMDELIHQTSKFLINIIKFKSFKQWPAKTRNELDDLLQLSESKILNLKVVKEMNFFMSQAANKNTANPSQSESKLQANSNSNQPINNHLNINSNSDNNEKLYFNSNSELNSNKTEEQKKQEEQKKIEEHFKKNPPYFANGRRIANRNKTVANDIKICKVENIHEIINKTNDFYKNMDICMQYIEILENRKNEKIYSCQLNGLTILGGVKICDNFPAELLLKTRSNLDKEKRKLLKLLIEYNVKVDTQKLDLVRAELTHNHYFKNVLNKEINDLEFIIEILINEDKIIEQDWNNIFLKNLENHEKELRKLFANENDYNRLPNSLKLSLLSICYKTGINGFRKSNLFRELKEENLNWDKIAFDIMNYHPFDYPRNFLNIIIFIGNIFKDRYDQIFI